MTAQVKLVTIHGTGAGDVTSSGDKWWQLGSVFLQDIGQRLELDPAKVEVVPFQWDIGPNSEQQRREAGNKLSELLNSYDEAGHDYYLVGHSHGGSVIYNSLLRSVADKRPFERLKIWCTVGTPFLDYRPNTFLFQRLKSLGLTLCTSGIVSFLLGCWIMIMTFTRESVEDILVVMGFAMILYGLINYFLLWLYERRKKSWFTREQKKQVEKHYKDKWCGLWHQEDEAISALSNIRNISAPIIPSTFLQPIVASVQFGLVILIGLFFAADLALNQGLALVDIATFFSSCVDANDELIPNCEESHSVGYLTWMVTFMMLTLVIPFIWVFTKALSLFARLIGRPLAHSLNNIIWTSIKQRAWGDDLLKEDVHSVSSQPPEFAHKCDFLNEDIANPLREHSEKNAIKTLHKVRVVLGMTQTSTNSPDIRSELSESLNWQELIHTSYFEVPGFIDLLAKNLKEAGLE